MSQPSSRSTFKEYCLRQLGAPVLEVNVADEQVDDLIDDGLQYWNERHYDGVTQMYMKYAVTQQDIDRGKANKSASTTNTAGIVTTTADATIAGVSTSFDWYENSNYLQVPPEIIGVNKIMHFDGTNTATNNMFSVKYQLFLNDIYYWGTTEILTYAMTRTYLEDIEFALTTQKQIRFNQRQDRLYLDIDWSAEDKDNWLVIECFRIVDPNSFTGIYNDSFLKRYLTALIKRQWGQNLIKFTGVKLPGGIELNGRQIYDDAQVELDKIQEMMSNTYELPPFDMIG